MTRLDGLKPDERKLAGVSRHELADLLCGHDYRKAQEAIGIARNRVQSAVNRNREFESGRKVATTLIREGLDRQGETGILNDEDDDG